MKLSDTSGPVGLGGWLILVGLGLVFTPLRLLSFIGQTFVPIFTEGSWELLTTPGSEVYHPLWGPLIVFELAVNGGFLLAGIGLLILFFMRSPVFPKAYIWVALLNLPLVLLDAWLTTRVLPDQPMFDADTARELGRSFVAVAIWVPYMLVSRRVRNTFAA